jgi:hypothetical protein
VHRKSVRCTRNSYSALPPESLTEVTIRRYYQRMEFQPLEYDDAEEQFLQTQIQLFTELDKAEDEMRKAGGLKKLMDGYLELFPQLKELLVASLDEVVPAPDGRPKGADAVRSILQEHSGIWFLVSELVDELRDRGWLPESDNPASAVRAALERLISTEDSDIYKGRRTSPNGGNPRVIYKYDPDYEPEVEAPSDEEPF